MASGTYYPTVSGDDGYASYGSSFDNSAPNCIIGSPGGWSVCTSFFRFINVTIPNGATIDSAYVKITAYATGSSTTVNVRLSANDVDNATAPTSYAQVTGLSLTTANVDWDNVAGWSDGTQYNSPDISSVIQEVVSRGGWSSGNALTVVIANNSSTGSSFRNCSAIDHSSGAEKIELHVEWSLNEVEVGAFTSVDALSNNIAIDLDNILFSSQNSLSAESTAEIEITTNTFSSVSSLSGEIEYEIIVEASFSSTNSISNNIDIEISFGTLESISSLNISIDDIEILSLSPVIVHRGYVLILTGDADGVSDITIPIKSFQCRLNTISIEQAYERIEYFTRIVNEYNAINIYDFSIKYGEYISVNYSTHLSVVIPGFDYIDYINDRLHGSLVIKLVYLDTNNEIVTSEIITTVLFEDIDIFDGSMNKSIVLEGHGIEESIPENIVLTDITYKSIRSGSVRYRCNPDLYLRPGDTAIGTINISDIVWLLPFTGGITEILSSSTVTGESSGASGVVSSVEVTSGAWWSHNAVGIITLNSISGTFQSENIKVGEDVVAVTNGETIKTYSPGEDSFTVDSITYSVTSEQELYEVSE